MVSSIESPGPLLEELLRLAAQDDPRTAAQLRELCRKALAMVERATKPGLWAALQCTLGTACAILYGATGAYAEEAQEAFAAALQVFTRRDYPMEWAMTQHNLGNLYSRRYDRTGREEDGLRAEECYRAALEVLDPEVAPAHALLPASSLARLLARQKRWAEAHEGFRAALAAARRQHLSAPGEAERRRIMAEHAALYAEDALCLAHQGLFLQALATMDEGKARLLAEATGYERIALARAGEDGRLRWQEAHRNLLAADALYEAAQEEAIRAPTPEALDRRDEASRVLVQARRALEALALELGLEPPLLKPEDLAAWKLPPDMAIIALAITERESQAFILHQQGVNAIPLPDLSRKEVTDLVLQRSDEVDGWFDRYVNLSRWGIALAMGERGAEGRWQEAKAAWQEALEEIAATGGEYQAGWLLAYHLFYNAVMPTAVRGHPAWAAAEQAWHRCVQNMTEELGRRLWVPLDAFLKPRGIARIIFIPSGVLHILPLHAGRWTRDGKEVWADEVYRIGYAPSLSVLSHCRDRLVELKRQGPPTLAAASNPTADLEFAAGEVAALKELFDRQGWEARISQGEQAKKETFLKMVAGAHYIHFSGHGRYFWEEPMASGLAFFGSRAEDGSVIPDLLTLDEVQREMDLSAARLVVLSACETGVTAVTEAAEEYVGLPAGFLIAGAPAVVASLWPVNDASTGLLMERFYENHLERGMEVAEALCEAQRWLRTLPLEEALARYEPYLRRGQERMSIAAAVARYKELVTRSKPYPFAEPYFWAPFVAVGAVMS